MTPLEPLYTLRVAAELIPYPGSVRNFRDWLYRHRDQFPGRYQRRRNSYFRLLSNSELHAIRDMLVKDIRQTGLRHRPIMTSPQHRASA